MTALEEQLASQGNFRGDSQQALAYNPLSSDHDQMLVPSKSVLQYDQHIQEEVKKELEELNKSGMSKSQCGNLNSYVK